MNVQHLFSRQYMQLPQAFVSKRAALQHSDHCYCILTEDAISTLQWFIKVGNASWNALKNVNLWNSPLMMPVERSTAICALLVHNSLLKKRVFRRYLGRSNIHKLEASTDKSHTCFYITINFQASRYVSPTIAFFFILQQDICHSQ